MTSETTVLEMEKEPRSKVVTVRFPYDLVESYEVRARIENKKFADYWRERVLLALSFLDGRTSDKITMEDVFELLQQVHLEQSATKNLLFLKDDSDELAEGLGVINGSVGNLEGTFSDFKEGSKSREDSILSKVGKLGIEIENLKKAVDVVHRDTEGIPESAKTTKVALSEIKREFTGPIRMMKLAFAEWKLFTVVISVSFIFGGVIGLYSRGPYAVYVQYEDVQKVVHEQLKEMGKANEGKEKPTDQNTKGKGR